MFKKDALLIASSIILGALGIMLGLMDIARTINRHAIVLRGSYPVEHMPLLYSYVGIGLLVIATIIFFTVSNKKD